MEHHFNVGIAEDFGIEGAIFLHNLFFWIHKNEKNRTNFYEGRYWTYNTTRAFSELFPYMSESKVSRTLKALEEKGVIVKGNFNKLKFDRTSWYSFSDKGFSYMEKYGYSRNEECIPQNEGMETDKMKNGDLQNDGAIPDSKQDNKTSYTNRERKTSPRFVKPTIKEIEDYCRERGNDVDAETFFDFYESKGWKVGNTTMKDWKASVRTWEKREKKSSAKEKRGSKEPPICNLDKEWEGWE